MITKEHELKKTCLFCASEYHLEMILLPYLKERLEKRKIIIFTESDLENTMKILIQKVNLKVEDKEKIISINWKKDDKHKMQNLQKYIEKNDEITVVINGKLNYIQEIKEQIECRKNIEIIECFHVADPTVDVRNFSEQYDEVLSTIRSSS